MIPMYECHYLRLIAQTCERLILQHTIGPRVCLDGHVRRQGWPDICILIKTPFPDWIHLFLIHHERFPRSGRSGSHSRSCALSHRTRFVAYAISVDTRHP